MDKRRKLAE